jgi:uncharacterized membrane protein
MVDVGDSGSVVAAIVLHHSQMRWKKKRKKKRKRKRKRKRKKKKKRKPIKRVRQGREVGCTMQC